MPNTVKYLAHQIPSLKALGRVVASSVKKLPKDMPAIPTQPVQDTIPARSSELLDAYHVWTGAQDVDTNIVPAHLFPQWAFPFMIETFSGLPFRLMSILNQGARIEVHEQVQANQPLKVEATLESAIAGDGKMRMTQRISTIAQGQDKGLVCEVYTFVPHGKKSASKQVREATDESKFKEIGAWSATVADGQDFAFITGDLNPIHWIVPYAKISGFKNTILHGFGILARSYALIESTQGKPIRAIDVRFIKPLVLPNQASVLLSGTGKKREVILKDSKGVTCMVGSVEF